MGQIGEQEQQHKKKVIGMQSPTCEDQQSLANLPKMQGNADNQQQATAGEPKLFQKVAKSKTENKTKKILFFRTLVKHFIEMFSRPLNYLK